MQIIDDDWIKKDGKYKVEAMRLKQWETPEAKQRKGQPVKKRTRFLCCAKCWKGHSGPLGSARIQLH
jgi:hypothetical protein